MWLQNFRSNVRASFLLKETARRKVVAYHHFVEELPSWSPSERQIMDAPSTSHNSIRSLRPGSYVAFLPCRMQFKQKIMRQIISLSIVSIAFDTAEMRRMNRALNFRPIRFKKTEDRSRGLSQELQLTEMLASEHCGTAGQPRVSGKPFLSVKSTAKTRLRASRMDCYFLAHDF